MKRYVSIFILMLLLFGIASSIQAQEKDYPTIVQDYPELPACQNNQDCRPGQGIFGVPEFIKYIYIFAIGIVGIIGLVAIIMAAFGYVTSAGNPQQASNAKDKIISALLGMVLLLGSVVFLRMINPDFLRLKLEAEKVEISTDVDKCKQKCAEAGPPSPDCLAKCEREETSCSFTKASWSRNNINAGESATLTLTFTADLCRNKAYMIDLPLRQVAPGMKNPTCIIFDAASFTKISESQLQVVYTFNKKCRPGILQHVACIPSENIICNYIEDGYENFYIEGEVRVVDSGITQIVPRLNINVIDNK